MMRILYLDCSMGCAGDMFSAALLDALSSGEAEAAIAELNDLAISGVRFSLEPVVVGGIAASRLHVTVHGEEEGSGVPDDHGHGHSHDHGGAHGRAQENGHGHGHAHSRPGAIASIIEGLALAPEVRDDAIAIYDLIARAEAAVHGRSVSEVHFHEVGALDAVADVVAASLLVRRIAPDAIVASPMNVGSGTVHCAHGRLPVPPPAVVELLKGIPSHGMMAPDGSPVGELCTPTGAAIVRHFTGSFGPQPAMAIEACGYGAGHNDAVDADAFRVLIGTALDDAVSPSNAISPDGDALTDSVVQLMCNIDDMTPEDLGFALDVLNGSDEVLDALFVPVQMKKSRPGTMLIVLVRPQHVDIVIRLIFEHTTTLGIRACPMDRMVLDRTVEERETPIGRLRVKASSGYGTAKEKIEFDDLADEVRSGAADSAE